MRQIFIKELSAFSVEELAVRLGMDADRALSCVSVLSAKGVLRLRSGDDGDQYDTDDPAKLRGKYQFRFVGLCVYEELIVVVYPKYLDAACFEGDEVSSGVKPRLQQIFRVLHKSAGGYSEIAPLPEGARKIDGRIALMLALIDMYDEYGVYSNDRQVLSLNGPGAISWERTISGHQPVMSGESPIYLECETVSNEQDESDFITRLHRCVLTECSCFMSESGLGPILSLDEIDLSGESLDDMGDRDFVLDRLARERDVQFVTWKLELLDLLDNYICGNRIASSSDGAVCLGSVSFYNIWEKACKIAFGDMLAKRIGEVGLELTEKWKRRNSETLKKIVPSPQWTQIVDGGLRDCDAVNTLVPDTVLIWELNGGDKAFLVLDAKYYTPGLDGKPRGVPGVESVTKQILYQRAYRDFVVDHEVGSVVNAFLVPSDGDDFKLVGHVEFPGVFDPVDEPFSNGVDMWMLPAARIWQCYLSGKALQPNELELLIGPR